MTAKTPGKMLHDAILEILRDDVEELAIDDRTVSVWDHFPESTFSQNSMPVIAVEYPEKDEQGNWGGNYERRVYRVPFAIVDVYGVRPNDQQEVSERLERLFDNIKSVFRKESNQHLNLVNFHIFQSMGIWEEDEPLIEGSNLQIKPVNFTIGMVVNHDIIEEEEP